MSLFASTRRFLLGCVFLRDIETLSYTDIVAFEVIGGFYGIDSCAMSFRYFEQVVTGFDAIFYIFGFIRCGGIFSLPEDSKQTV